MMASSFLQFFTKSRENCSQNVAFAWNPFVPSRKILHGMLWSNSLCLAKQSQVLKPPCSWNSGSHNVNDQLPRALSFMHPQPARASATWGLLHHYVQRCGEEKLTTHFPQEAEVTFFCLCFDEIIDCFPFPLRVRWERIPNERLLMEMLDKPRVIQTTCNQASTLLEEGACMGPT